METPRRPADDPAEQALAGALARLQSRWGSASIRLGNGDRASGHAAAIGRATAFGEAAARGPAALGGGDHATASGHGSLPGHLPVPGHVAPPDHAAASGREASRPLTLGALALAPALDPEPDPSPDARPRHDPLEPLRDDIVSTGFPDLDAALGPGGLPRQASAAIRGDLSSGKTTLALRCIAEAQAQGAIAAWLDLPRAFDPIDAVARGVDLRWLLVIRPADPAEGFALAGALLSGRAVDLLAVDLPVGLPARQEGAIRRLSAHAKRVGARFIVLEPPTLPGGLHGALAEVTGLRLELEREAWIRLGRDVVGQQTRVTVAKNRFGPPGRHVALEIHYASEGERRVATHRFAGR